MGGEHAVVVRAAEGEDVPGLADLLQRTFADPSLALGPDPLREFLASDPAHTGRSFTALLAMAGDLLLGATVFSYIPETACGFSEYLVVRREHQRRGVGRTLMERRKKCLDVFARRQGLAGCRGLFVEAENPVRTPLAVAVAERETAMDILERRAFFARHGFFQVDVPYIQPPLGPGKRSVDYLDLLFAPWEPVPGRIPAMWVSGTLRPVWRAWDPQSEAALAGMSESSSDSGLELLPLSVQGSN